MPRPAKHCKYCGSLFKGDGTVCGLCSHKVDLMKEFVKHRNIIREATGWYEKQARNDQAFIEHIEFKLDWNMKVTEEELERYYKLTENDVTCGDCKYLDNGKCVMTHQHRDPDYSCGNGKRKGD